MSKTININIENLIGKIEVSSTSDFKELENKVQTSLLKAINSVSPEKREGSKAVAVEKFYTKRNKQLCEIEHPISITIQSDLLLKIPRQKLSAIVEATLNQIQIASLAYWWKDASQESPSEALELSDTFSVQTHIHTQEL